MSGRIERSIEELYRDDPERADAVVFGRETAPSRRGFFGGAGLAAMGAAVGGVIPFGQTMPAGLIPAALAQGAPAATPPAAPAAPAAAPKGPQYLQFPGKSDKLVVLGEKPLVAETPESLLDDDTTPTDKFFIRNNGLIPDQAKDADSWKITVDGEVNNKLELTLGELKSKFNAGDAPHGSRMRRQRAFFLHAAGPRQSVDQWRRRLRGMDRRSGRGRAEGRRAQAFRGVQRALRFRSASLRRAKTLAVARGAAEEIDGRKQSDRLGDERPAVAEYPWLPRASGRAGLARIDIEQVAHPHLDSRQGA